MTITLQVDYEVKTRQGRAESVHTPNPKIHDIHGNIMIIEGPNSSGKSTLMNLIAIGAYGETDESLSASMRSNLKELTESSYRDISFDIIIQDPRTGKELQFVRKCGSRDNIVLENGVQLNEQQFRQRYNLIYDIPENPTARIKSITKTIKDDHRAMLARVSDFNNYVSSVWKRIDGKLTEADVVRIEKDISQAEKELKQISSEGSDSKLPKLEMLLHIRKYLDTRELLDKIQQKIDFEMNKPTMSGAMREMESNAGKLEKQILDIQPKSIGAVSDSDNQIVRDYQKLIMMWNDIRGCNTSELDSRLEHFEKALFSLKGDVPDVSEEARALDIVNNAMEALSKIDTREKIGDLG